MKKLLNTLYVTSENSYLGLEGETIVVYDNQAEIGRLPLHNLEGIVSFGYRGTSPALMGACAERNISICYLSPQGKFLARVSGKIRGNVLLREQQYKSCKDEDIQHMDLIQQPPVLKQFDLSIRYKQMKASHLHYLMAVFYYDR